MTEIWRTAVYDDEIYEGLYKVSNWGRILSLNYQNTGKSKLRTPVQGKDGYLRVLLRKNGEYKMCLVHRIIATTFLENPENKPCINHKIEGDEGKKINMVIFNEDGTLKANNYKLSTRISKEDSILKTIELFGEEVLARILEEKDNNQ